MNNPHNEPATRDLRGLRIVLSGSVPDRKHWRTDSDDLALLEFVRDFAGLVFQHCGRIVHGCHPSLTPVLIQQAERFGPGPDGKPRLILLMSEFWAHDLPAAIGSWYDQHAEFWIVAKGRPTDDDPKGVQASLSALRRELVAIGNVLVAVGGNLRGIGKGPGVDEEVTLAIGARRPTFLLGGLGGRTAGLAPELRRRVSAGDLLTEAERQELAGPDASRTLGPLLAHLLRHRDALLAFGHRDVRATYKDYVAGALQPAGPARIQKRVLDQLLTQATARTTITANGLAAAMHRTDGRLQKMLLEAVHRRAQERVFELAEADDPEPLIAPLIDKALLDELPEALRASADDLPEHLDEA